MYTNQVVLETKLVSDIKGTFIVPSYQRGYRWGKNEVLRLLNDVFSNGKKNYCLQPIVVKKRKKISCEQPVFVKKRKKISCKQAVVLRKRKKIHCKRSVAVRKSLRKEDSFYELVDGQQRLTTLYLIYRYMNTISHFFSAPDFTLEYEVRDKSGEFLQSIDWNRREENIDFYFIANAYENIKNWFNEDVNRISCVYQYFKKHVKIIWYEVGENEDAISLFTRLNIGKIPLTNAELVKATFLSSVGKSKTDREKQKEISLQWDTIEKDLYDDSLWYFLTNSTNTGYQTRIDLILDLISEKPENNREKYYTFFKIVEEKGKTKSLEDLWLKIQKTMLLLKDWYDEGLV